MVCNRWHQHIALTHGLKQIRLVHGAIMLVQGNVKEFTHPSLNRRREPTGADDLWMSGGRSFQHKLALSVWRPYRQVPIMERAMGLRRRLKDVGGFGGGGEGKGEGRKGT